MTASEGGTVSAWVLMTAGENREHGGNAGYDDQPDVYYTWDNTVYNHARLEVGDAIVLWDKKRLLGLSVVEEIEEHDREKLLFKCPHCGKAGIKARTVKLPRFRCSDCHEEFVTPTTEIKTVHEYRSRHDAAWTPLEGLLTGSELRGLCESPASQLSIRQFRWDSFQQLIEHRGAGNTISRVARRADIVFPQGHQLELVRVRRGQTQFREHLLATQGESCAFTGEAPARVLEAGHLYSYAELGVHYEHGGLVLRRDIHRLFDDGWLAVDPSSMKVDVSPMLEAYPQYAALHGRALLAKVADRQMGWLFTHWSEHRAI